MKQPKVLTKQEEIHLFVFFIPCFTVSVAPSINTLEFSSDFMILIISLISSFKINKVNLFPPLTGAFPLIFLSNLFIALEAKLLTNPGKLSLSKEIVSFVLCYFA